MKAVRVEKPDNFHLSQNEENEGPEGWAFPKVGDILEINYGKGLIGAKRKAGLIPVYGSNGVVGYHDEPLTDGQSIILGRKGSVGAVHFSKGPCWPIDTTYFINNFHCLRAKYVFYALGSLGLASLDKSSAIPGINRDDIYSQTIPIPPLAEQDRIVSKVDELLAGVNAARERLAKVPGILKQFRQSVLAAACSGRLTADWRERQTDLEPAAQLLERIRAKRTLEYERACQRAKRQGERTPREPANLDFIAPKTDDLPALPELPEDWSLIEVIEAAKFIQYGTSVKSDGNIDTGIPVLRMGNIQDGKIDLSDLKFMTSKGNDIATFLLQSGDLLFNRTNSPELVGKTAVFNLDLKAVFASYLIRLHSDEKLMLSDLICYWINSPWGREWAQKVKTDGVSQSNINATKLGEMPIPLPPLAEQLEIVRRVEALFRLADAIEARVAAGAQRAGRLTQAILAKAFRGELVPTEAELARREGRDYEPAAVLLSRLQEERRLINEAQPRRQTLKGRKQQTSGT